MKINMPVTDNEVNFDEGDTLVSTTDLKGTITYVNQEFIDVSGFSEAELIGHNHNIVRHPDIPPAAFEDLWGTLKEGKPWVQVLKNRCKNGDFYWVKANVTPVWKDGNIVEYMSVRSKPTREEIKAAEIALQKIKDGKLGLKNGNPVKTGIASVLAKFGNIKLAHQFIVLGVIFAFLVAVIVAKLSIQKENVDFSSKELLGVEYVKPLRSLLELAPQHRGMTNAYLKGNTGFESQIKQRRKDIDEAFSQAFQVDSQLGESLNTTQHLNALFEEWKSIKSLAFSLTPGQSFARHTEFIDDILQLIIYVGDTSNLVLDPDLDSSYNMELIINHIPQLVEFMGQARGLGAGIIAEGGVPSAAQQQRIDELTIALNITFKAVTKSYKSAATASQEVASALGTQEGEAEAAITEFITAITAVRDGRFRGDSQALFQAGTRAIGESFALYDQSANLLEALLERRVDSLSFTFYLLSTLTALSVLLVTLIGITVSRKTLNTIKDSLTNLAAIRNGDYSQTLEMNGNNELSSLTRSITTMRIKNGFDVEDSAKRAAAATRVRQALDVCNTNVMMADSNLNIIYMNNAVKRMFKDAEKDLQKDLSEFDAEKLMGANVDIFHKNPTHQRQMMAALTDPYETTIKIGGRTFTLVTTPVFGDNGNRLGTVVEWEDRTNEVAIEKEIDAIVESASQGDLSKRISLDDKEGFFKKLSVGLNELLESSSSFVSDIGQLFAQLAEGDLTKSIEQEYDGDFQRIKEDANSTISKLTEIITQIREAANTVHTAADEIAQGNTDLSQRTEEQASSLEETASSMEEITATVKQSSDNAGEANQLATDAKNKAEHGGAIVQEAVEAMKEILTSSNRINDIIGVIDEIAFQTNLLALNAAVEAARAGEQGRGFAVVAGEVRNLSKRSADAAKEIKNLIRDSVVKVETGSNLVNESGDTLGAIVNAVDRVASMINEVNNAAAEQTSGIEQINQAVAQMDEMTQQNAALVEEASAASEAMSEQASGMNRLIGFFKVGGYISAEPIENTSQPEAIKSYQPRSYESKTTGNGNAASFSNDDDWEDF
ncbi:methyl-accepting chemotaxis protein [Alkalimarinus coralli]|uniref:methyl-accepting chemotaxis protein n=1 Tax=Alkalimarinus coralli TaxID=2935863 RepID=UPI00202B374B|nr:methyl-accepting chemotaxis protein [Alkalimarinus coralli]